MPAGWVAAGTAVLGAAASAYSANKQAGAAEDAANRSMWNVPNNQDLISRAKTIADQPYQPYYGNRVAGLDPNETQAYDLARTGFQPAESAYAAERQQVDNVANNTWSKENIDKYMNPYVTDVVNRSLDANRRAYDTTTGDIGARAAQMGAFGGSQQALMESQANKNYLQTAGDIATKGYADAYDKAVGAWTADNARMTNAAAAYSRVGGDVTQLNQNEMTALLQTGGANRMIQQMNLDTKYKDWIEQRDWTKTNFQELKDAVSVANGNKSSYVPSQSGQVGAQLAGTAAALVGYFGSRTSGAGPRTYADNSYASWGLDPNNPIGVDKSSIQTVDTPSLSDISGSMDTSSFNLG